MNYYLNAQTLIKNYVVMSVFHIMSSYGNVQQLISFMGGGYLIFIKVMCTCLKFTIKPFKPKPKDLN